MQKPGELNFGSTGVGIPLYLTMEMLSPQPASNLCIYPLKVTRQLLQSLDRRRHPGCLRTGLPRTRRQYISAAGTLRKPSPSTTGRGPSDKVLADAPTGVRAAYQVFDSSSWQVPVRACSRGR